MKRGKGQNALSRRLPPTVILVISVTTYCAVWIFISVMRYLSLNANVYDLGISVQRAWILTHYYLSPSGYVYIFSTSGLVFLFAPLGLTGDPILFLVVQALAMGLSSIIIFLIAQLKIESTLISVLISLSFLIYFPLAGVTFFDFHYEAFLIPFFLLGYYLYLRKRYALSFVSFFLAGSAKFPFFAFIILFSLIELFFTYYDSRTSPIEKNPVSMKWLQSGAFFFLISTLIISTGMLALGNFMGMHHGLALTLHVNSVSGITYSGFLNTTNVYYLMLLPFLFLPLFSRWVVYLMPSYALILISNNDIYYSTAIFHEQYTSAIIPFIFLGVIFSLARSGSLLKRIHKSIKSIKSLSPLRLRKFVAICSTIIVILMGLSYLPYGPANSTSASNFNLGDTISYNHTQYETLTEFVRMIPQSDPYVLVQNNLPQAYPRIGPMNGSVLVPGVIGPNISIYDAINNSFPFLTGGTVKIDYVLADVNNIQNFKHPVANLYGLSSPEVYGIPSMEQILTILLESGRYSIIAEENGFILVARN